MRWLRGGASAGARAVARHGAGVRATTSRWTERGARRRRRSARADDGGWGTEKVRKEREEFRV